MIESYHTQMVDASKEQSPHASTGPDPYPASAPSGDFHPRLSDHVKSDEEIEQLTNATGCLE